MIRNVVPPVIVFPDDDEECWTQCLGRDDEYHQAISYIKDAWCIGPRILGIVGSPFTGSNTLCRKILEWASAITIDRGPVDVVRLDAMSDDMDESLGISSGRVILYVRHLEFAEERVLERIERMAGEPGVFVLYSASRPIYCNAWAIRLRDFTRDHSIDVLSTVFKVDGAQLDGDRIPCNALAIEFLRREREISSKKNTYDYIYGWRAVVQNAYKHDLHRHMEEIDKRINQGRDADGLLFFMSVTDNPINGAFLELMYPDGFYGHISDLIDYGLVQSAGPDYQMPPVLKEVMRNHISIHNPEYGAQCERLNGIIRRFVECSGDKDKASDMRKGIPNMACIVSSLLKSKDGCAVESVEDLVDMGFFANGFPDALTVLEKLYDSCSGLTKMKVGCELVACAIRVPNMDLRSMQRVLVEIEDANVALGDAAVTRILNLLNFEITRRVMPESGECGNMPFGIDEARALYSREASEGMDWIAIMEYSALMKWGLYGQCGDSHIMDGLMEKSGEALASGSLDVRTFDTDFVSRERVNHEFLKVLWSTVRLCDPRLNGDPETRIPLMDDRVGESQQGPKDEEYQEIRGLKGGRYGENLFILEKVRFLAMEAGLDEQATEASIRMVNEHMSADPKNIFMADVILRNLDVRDDSPEYALFQKCKGDFYYEVKKYPQAIDCYKHAYNSFMSFSFRCEAIMVASRLVLAYHYNCDYDESRDLRREIDRFIGSYGAVVPGLRDRVYVDMRSII